MNFIQMNLKELAKERDEWRELAQASAKEATRLRDDLKTAKEQWRLSSATCAEQLVQLCALHVERDRLRSDLAAAREVAAHVIGRLAFAKQVSLEPDQFDGFIDELATITRQTAQQEKQ